MRKISLLRIKVVYHNIRIRSTACREDYNLSKRTELSNEIMTMRSHPNSCLYSLKNTDIDPPSSIGKISLVV